MDDKELQHEHPLKLIDLQLMHRDYEEDDDDYDDNELIATQNFKCTCNRCGRQIDWVCGMQLEDEHLLYKCSKCMYYVHSDCATQKTEPFMSILLPGLGKTEKNFKDVDHPNLLHFPLADESHILSHHLIKWDTYQHISHEHPVVLVHDKINNATTTSRIKSLSLHELMKRIKLLCTGCSRPITKMPFYKCSIDDNSCDLVLHDECTRLPTILEDHVGHPQHTLWLVNVPSSLGFICLICGLSCNGFSYNCFEYKCNYMIDVNCGFIPEEITHEAHANHLLKRMDASSSLIQSKVEFRACRESIINTSEIYYRCSACDFYLDCRCALLLPKTVRHKFDKHPLKLSYSPVEDHKSQYFCEICEDDLDPGKWFYHCVECVQSMHSACAPLKLQSEQGVNSRYLEGVYKFINIKFGVVEERDFHEHPVSFAPGTENDGSCQFCGRKLQSNMIWKCLQCNFACHYHDCIYYTVFPEFAPVGIDAFVGNKRMIKHKPQTNSGFYPSETIRPVTRHWKVVDDIQR